MEFFLVQLLNSLSYGLLLFMLSSGLTLIFGMMGVLNFAHASFYMLGAYAAYTQGLRIGFWPALILAPILVGLLAALVERHGLRRVHRFRLVVDGRHLLFFFLCVVRRVAGLCIDAWLTPPGVVRLLGHNVRSVVM